MSEYCWHEEADAIVRELIADVRADFADFSDADKVNYWVDYALARMAEKYPALIWRKPSKPELH